MEWEFIKIKQDPSKLKKPFRVVTIDVDTYELIKAHCQKNDLKISKWVGSEIKNLILSKTS